MTVDVPLNTALADFDEALRALLKRELGRHGFEGVDIAFDAPAKDWSGKLTNPTVNCYLYDLREASEQAGATSRDVRVNGGVIERPPALKLEVTYAVTAWTKAVEDEHRLLSQVLAVLFSHRVFPTDLLDEHLSASVAAGGLQTAVGRPREDKSDFWSAVGGQYKASVDYVVRMELQSGAFFERGPEVRVQTLRPRLKDGPARTLTELVRFGGTVSDPDGGPVPDAWVALPEVGKWTATGPDGRFIFDRVPAGPLRVVARTARGEEAQLDARVPGTPVDLIVEGQKGRRR